MPLPPQSPSKTTIWPLAFGLFFFIALTLGGTWWVQKKNIDTLYYRALDRVEKAYHNHIAEHAKILATHLDNLEENPTLRKVFITNDWKRLNELATPFINKLGRHHQITHLYFIDMDKRIVARAHFPQEVGDKANFATLHSAAQGNGLVWGVETGKFGTLALRVVRPWRIGGIIKGYVMVGSNLDHILDLLKTNLGMESLLLLDKAQIKQADWQKGSIFRSPKTQWGFFPNKLLAYSTLPVDSVLLDQLKTFYRNNSDVISTFSIKGKPYRASTIELTSYNGQPIAQLIPLYSFADLQQENFNFLLLLAIALSCLAGALLVFLNSRLKGQNQIVKNFMRDLFRERKERARAENQLVTHRDRLSAAVEERTRDLHLSNQKLKTQIIEKKQAVSALKESEARYRSIVENSHIGIGIINDNYTLIYANEKTGQIFGRKTSDLFGMDIRHLIAFKEIMERYLNRQQGQKEPDHYQLTIFRPNGEQREIEIIARLVTSSDGKKWTITQMLDITERQKMEQELRLSEEKHRNILASIDEGYFELKPDGEIAFCNDSLARQLNTDKQDLIGKNFRNFVDDETAETLSTVFKNLKLINEPIIIGECIVNTGPEQSKVFEISGSVIRNDSRDPLGIRGVARDVTERIKGQRQRQKKEAQLNQAHKMEAVGALASGVAHDFNNVLQAISAYVELLQASSDLQKDSRDTLEKIDQVIERAAQLVRHLLSFGREDDLETKALDLNQMVLQVADILRHTLPKMVEIKTQLCPQPTIIQGEPSRLEQVIMNLGINAKDAMPDGGILTLATSLVFLDESHVALNPKAQIGNHIKLSVADTGTGMDEKTKEHLFEPFFTTKEPGQGTGLGMATVYGIVNSLGGHIVFESSPGKGATFDIYFPLMDQKTLDIPVIQQKPSQEPADASNEACILLVDDEEVILEVGKSLLEDFGYLVHTASSGETALELIKKDKTAFDAIILDLNMPGMGGHKTLTEILRINPQAKVLIASGYATDDMTQKNLAAGAAAFINKPFRMKTLLEKLNQILTQKI